MCNIKMQSKIILPHDTKRRIFSIAINNGWNTQVVQILCERRDGEFIFKGNILSMIPKPVELSHNWVLTDFKYQEPAFYARLFNKSEEGSFEVPTGRTKVGVIINPVPGTTKLNLFQ